MDILSKDNGSEGAFRAIDDGMEIGEMTYLWEGNRMVVDHTGVAPQYEGQGIGRDLFVKAVEYAREKNARIIPVCPFVATMFRRMPETQDVLEVE